MIDEMLPHIEVRKFLHFRNHSDSEFNSRFSEFTGLPSAEWARDVNHIIKVLTGISWWWHLSHVEAVVIPTRDVEGLFNNGLHYDWQGYPVRYTESILGDVAHGEALCRAYLKSIYDLPTAFCVRASAVEQAQIESYGQY